jgi:plastocyanin
VFNPKVAFPSGRHTYNGTGFVSSGILALNAPQNSKVPPTYRLTFTRPGTYQYDCLVHPNMEGSITVLP